MKTENTKTLLLICGGQSEEHEISLISAKCILDALDRTKFTPLVVGISRQGEWFLQDEKTFFTGELRADKIALNRNAPTLTLAPFPSAARQGSLTAAGKTYTFDVAFPILHGPYGEDGRIQGMLEMMGIPYVGSNCGSSWICMDKALTKTLCAREGIAVAPFVTLHTPADLDRRRQEVEALGFPAFVKPCRLGSSVGIAKAKSFEEIKTAVAAAFKLDSKVLIESGISGREIECAVLGLNGKARVALPGEIIPASNIGWYSYEAKYLLADGAKTESPAKLTSDEVNRLQQFALKTFDLLECDGMARVDLFLESQTGKIYLNEVNTIPGFTPISMYPKMWQSSGLPYPELISRLVELALEKRNP